MEMKIILLGESNTGKTSLLKRYFDGIFQLKSTKTTIGASYQSLEVMMTTFSSPLMERVRVGIWDTAGAERFHSLTRHYYRETDLAIVCFDLMDCNNFFKVNKWIEELTESESECLIVLCGTKYDEVVEEEEEDSSGGRLSMGSTLRNKKIKKVPRSYINQVMTEWEIEFYLETSSKTGMNVDELFTQSVQLWYNNNSNNNKKRGEKDLIQHRKSKLISLHSYSFLSGGQGKSCCGGGVGGGGGGI